MKKYIWPAIGALFLFILIYGLMHYLGVHGGILPTLVFVLILLSFFRFGSATKRVRTACIVFASVVFLLSWKFTGPTAEWGRDRVEEKMPRENFDPKKEEPVALARFYEKTDHTVVKVPSDWLRNPITGERLARPGDDEFTSLLNRYERQEALKKGATQAKADATSAPAPYPSAPGNWKLYQQHVGVELQQDECREYRIQAQKGEYVTRGAAGGVVQGCALIYFNQSPEPDGTECVGQSISPSTNEPTRWIKFCGVNGPAMFSLYVYNLEQ